MLRRNSKECTKKSPNDYPKISFRVDTETKEEILSWINRVSAYYADRKKHGEFVKRKNDIIIEALQIGLQAIEEKILGKKITRKKELTLKEWQKRAGKAKSDNALF